MDGPIFSALSFENKMQITVNNCLSNDFKSKKWWWSSSELKCKSRIYVDKWNWELRMIQAKVSIQDKHIQHVRAC